LNKQNHIIDKVFIEVNTSSVKKAHEIKNQVGVFFQDQVFPEIEKILDEYDQQDTISRMDKLNIDISTASKNFMAEILSDTCRQFRERLEGAGLSKEIKGHEKPGIQKVLKEDTIEESFLFFLENGYLPWFGHEAYLDELSKPAYWKSKLKDAQFIVRIKSILSAQPLSINRIALQFSTGFIFSFIGEANNKFRRFSKDIRAFDRKLDGALKNAYLKLLVRFSVLDDMQRLSYAEEPLKLLLASDYHNEFRKLIDKLEIDLDLNGIDAHENADQEQGSDESFFEGKQNEILVKNAGLILLHPFLKHFFRNIGVVGTQDKIFNEKYELAVQSLHFLASGDENFFEANLILEKFLSGFSLKIPLQRNSLLTAPQKKEAGEVLKEVIKNWPALKNTSADGLRQMFLQRNGKLIKTENGYKLIVERKTQDVLLEKINWNISMVKLPWIKDLIFVEW